MLTRRHLPHPTTEITKITKITKIRRKGATLQHRNIATSQHRNIATSQHRNIAACVPSMHGYQACSVRTIAFPLHESLKLPGDAVETRGALTPVARANLRVARVVVACGGSADEQQSRQASTSVGAGGGMAAQWQTT